MKFENDCIESDKSVNRFSSTIAQLGEHSRDYEWKNGLKIGDEVDASHDLASWQPSTILGFDELIHPNGRAWKLAKIGFRVYTSTGCDIDSQGNRFQGLNSQYDEWMPLCSSNIARLHSYAREIYDSSDTIIRGNKNQVYAVFRPLLSKSFLLTECLNVFGSEGGYDKILDLLHK